MTFDIFVMQLFNGLSSFTILLLMALGLAIIGCGRKHRQEFRELLGSPVRSRHGVA